jgi:transcriptional regulator with XRE-family HTH domain
MKSAAGRTGKRHNTRSPGRAGRAMPSLAVEAPAADHGAGAMVARGALPKQTTDADRMVGLRITALRKAKGLSQTALGQAIGVTFQQVQKYEKGQNRIGAGRLRDIAQLLEVPVATFFDEDEQDAAESPEAFAFLRTPGALDLLRAFAHVEDQQVRRDVVTLVRSIARRCGTHPETLGEA